MMSTFYCLQLGSLHFDSRQLGSRTFDVRSTTYLGLKWAAGWGDLFLNIPAVANWLKEFSKSYFCCSLISFLISAKLSAGKRTVIYLKRSVKYTHSKSKEKKKLLNSSKEIVPQLWQNLDRSFFLGKWSWEQGCQIFLGTKYQLTTKLYQMSIKYNKRP
jgi:hypothetical protein